MLKIIFKDTSVSGAFVIINALFTMGYAYARLSDYAVCSIDCRCQRCRLFTILLGTGLLALFIPYQVFRQRMGLAQFAAVTKNANGTHKRKVAPSFMDFVQSVLINVAGSSDIRTTKISASITKACAADTSVHAGSTMDVAGTTMHDAGDTRHATVLTKYFHTETLTGYTASLTGCRGAMDSCRGALVSEERRESESRSPKVLKERREAKGLGFGVWGCGFEIDG